MKQPIIPKGILLPFVLLVTLNFAWALPNNLTDTMLAAFKRIMSMSDSQTAWIQVVCYLLGYGCMAIPGALVIQRYNYKVGIMAGLGMYAAGAFLFYPAMLFASTSLELCFGFYLLAIFVLFSGLAFLETSTNSYVCVIGPPETAAQRINFAQSFNPFGAISGIIISQIFVLSQLNTSTSAERAAMSGEQLLHIQQEELSAVTTTYMAVGAAMVLLLLAFVVTRMPVLKEENKIDLRGGLRRLMGKREYLRSVGAQFLYVGAQIAVWSFIIRFTMQQLSLDTIVSGLGSDAAPSAIIATLRQLEPLSEGFYHLCEAAGLDALLPRTAEQAGATYYVLSMLLFVIGRFVCTGLMRFMAPAKLLALMAVLATLLTVGAIYTSGTTSVYCLVAISGCMSLMFPTIYSLGIRHLGEDTKLGGAGMVMAIAGAAVLTQIQGIVSDSAGSIVTAYWVPAIAFMLIALYALTVRE